MSAVLDVHDLSAGEHAHAVHARLQDAFASDPVLAMLVPKMVNGLLRAVVHDLTVADLSGRQQSRRVPGDMNAEQARTRIVSVIEMSPMSVLNRKARAHVAQVVFGALYPRQSVVTDRLSA